MAAVNYSYLTLRLLPISNVYQMTSNLILALQGLNNLHVILLCVTLNNTGTTFF